MKALLLGLTLGLVIGCGNKNETQPQGQAKVSVKPVVPDSKEEPIKTSPKSTPKPATQKPGSVLWDFEMGDVVVSSPVIGPDGTVYGGSNNNKLYAFQTDSKGLAKSPWPMRGQNARHTGRAPKKE